MEKRDTSMRWFWFILGILALLLGAVWTLQGMNILTGSTMSGQTQWLVTGIILVVVGIALIVIGRPRGSKA